MTTTPGQLQRHKMNNCYVCNELIGENARTFKISVGFGDFYEMDYIIIHEDCYSESVIRDFMTEFDNPTI